MAPLEEISEHWHLILGRYLPRVGMPFNGLEVAALMQFFCLALLSSLMIFDEAAALEARCTAAAS
jgi:hypothetical protein